MALMKRTFRSIGSRPWWYWRAKANRLKRSGVGPAYDLFEAPAQPSFNILDAGAVWDGENKGIDEFIEDMFDPLIATAAGYVTRSVLGQDESGTYDIIEYDFNPPGATQTILLSYGMHGRETVPVYSAYRLAHYLINDPDVDPMIRNLRDNVRIKMIPSLGIWAGSQSPKSYTNSSNLNPVRNFPINREFIDLSTPLNGRGPSALSEAEAALLLDWLKANLDASFYSDWHTDYSFYGQPPTRDVWVFRSDYDQYTRPIILPIANALGARAASLYGVTPSVTLEDGLERISSGKYATEVLGIPWFTSEFSETRYGGRFGGNLDIQNQLTMMVSFINAMVKADLRETITSDRAALSAQSWTTDFRFPVNLFNDGVNTNWSLPEFYAAIDDLVAGSGGYAAVSDIGADASATYQLRALTLDPGTATRTVVFIGGKDSLASTTAGIEAALLLRLAQLLESADDYGLAALRASTKFIIIPTMNPYGFNVNAVDLNATKYWFGLLANHVARSDFNNGGTARPSRDLTPTGTVAEAVVVRSYLSAITPAPTHVIGIGTNPSDVNVLAVRRHTTANPVISDLAVSLGNTLLSVRPPFGGSAVVTLNNNVAANGDMANGLRNLGYLSSMTLSLGYSAFRTNAEAVANNRPTAQAFIAYLVDLLRALP